MKVLRNYWQFISFGLLIIVIGFLFLGNGKQLPLLQKIMIYQFMALLAHQSEEYIFPGGASLVINRGTYKEKDNFKRYPGNTQSILLVNLSAYIPYILGIICYRQIWLGVAIAFFSLMQFPGHVISMNKALKTWYNPGMATTIFILTPLSVAYFVSCYQLGVIHGIDYLFGALTFILIVILTVILPVQSLKNPKSPYVISDKQISKFEKVMSWAKLKKD